MNHDHVLLMEESKAVVRSSWRNFELLPSILRVDFLGSKTRGVASHDVGEKK